MIHAGKCHDLIDSQENFKQQHEVVELLCLSNKVICEEKYSISNSYYGNVEHDLSLILEFEKIPEWLKCGMSCIVTCNNHTSAIYCQAKNNFFYFDPFPAKVYHLKNVPDILNSMRLAHSCLEGLPPTTITLITPNQ